MLMHGVFSILLLLAALLNLTGPRRAQHSARMVSGILLLLALLLPAWQLYRGRNPSLKRGFNDRETMLAAEGRMLGAYIAENFAGGKVVLLPPLFPPVHAAPGLAALMQAGKGTIQFAQPDSPPSIISGGTYNREELRTFIRDLCGGTDAVVVSSHHGLYLREWIALKPQNAPALIMMLYPDPEGLGHLIHRHIVHAATMYTPPPDARARILEKGMHRMTSADAREFFTVVTRDNYANLTVGD